jgi:hypothetical protein
VRGCDLRSRREWRSGLRGEWDVQPTVDPQPRQAISDVVHTQVVFRSSLSFPSVGGGRNPMLAGSSSVEYSTTSGLSNSTA